MSKLGWAFFGLAVVILAGYLLNRGIYVGSSVKMTMTEVNLPIGKVTEPYYNKYCHYLLLNDVRLDWSTGSFDREKADDGFCSPLRISN